MQGHSLSRIHRRLLRQRSSRGLELLIQSRTHLQQSTSRLHRSMARPTRSRTRNLSLGPLVQHPPPSPRPGRNHTATSRKQIHNNTKESGLKIPTQNPGLDRRCTRYVALHPLRGATPDQKGCTAYGSGALRITRTNAESARRSPTHRRHAGGQLLMLQTSTAQFKTVAQGANLDGPIGERTGRPGRGCRGCRETGK